MSAKLALARWIVSRSHGQTAAVAAEEHFTRVVREGQAPEDVPEAPLPDGDPASSAGRCWPSASVSRRATRAGSSPRAGSRSTVRPVGELDVPRDALAGALVQAGKRRFVRFTG